MVFSDLWLLGLLLPLYLVWCVLWVAWPRIQQRRRRSASGTVRYSSTRRLKKLRPSWALRMRRGVQALRLLAVGLLVLGMARPQNGREHSEVSTLGVDIFLVIDTSGSMAALDLDADRAIKNRRNRLAVVKDVVSDFVKKRGSDQIGLVVFGTEAFTQCPLTLDHGVVDSFLDRVEIGMAGEATAIGNALGTAVKRLKDSEAASKVVVLLTDGKSNAGFLAPATAAELAKTYGVKVYTVGAGTRGKAPILVDTMFGKQVQYIDADIDEDTMKRIADDTGGAYFRAEDASALAAIYDQIDDLERTEITTRTYMEYDERFAMLVWPAVLLLLFELLLLGTRFRKLP